MKMKFRISTDSTLAKHILVLILAFITMECTGEDKRVDDNATNIRERILQDTGLHLTNNIPQWVSQLKDHDKTRRLKAASNLFMCSFVDKNRMNREKIGDQIVIAYEKEEFSEIKAAMLATLDVLEHPALSDILAKIAQSNDPEIRNLGRLIKEKRYLEPVVIEDPDVNRKSQIQTNRQLARPTSDSGSTK